MICDEDLAQRYCRTVRKTVPNQNAVLMKTLRFERMHGLKSDPNSHWRETSIHGTVMGKGKYHR